MNQPVLTVLVLLVALHLLLKSDPTHVLNLFLTETKYKTMAVETNLYATDYLASSMYAQTFIPFDV